MYLDELGLGEMQSEMDGSKASQRSAIAAAAAVDRSGLMLQKWAMTVSTLSKTYCYSMFLKNLCQHFDWSVIANC